MQQVARFVSFALALLCTCVGLFVAPASAQVDMVLWGDAGNGLITNAPVGLGVVDVAGGTSHFVGLRADGRLISWGSDVYGQVSQTPSGNDFVAVSAGNFHSLALRGDGSIVGWGRDNSGQVSGTPAGTQWVAISGCENMSLALNASGQLYAWGDDWHCEVTCLPTTGTYTAIGAPNHAVRSDGQIVNWGTGVNQTPPGNNFVQVSTKGAVRLGLRADGSLAAWGGIGYGIVSGLPPGNNFVKVAAGANSAMALRTDGTIVIWGSNAFSMVTTKPNENGYTDIPSIYSTTGVGLRDVDCNGNGVQDALDIANGSSFDCNQNGTPDECELLNPLLDLNLNGVLDDCEPDSGLSESKGMAYIGNQVLAGLPTVPNGVAEAIFDGYPGGLSIPISVFGLSTSFVIPPLTAPASENVVSDFYVRWNDASGTHVTPVWEDAFTWEVPRILVVTPPAVPASQNKIVQIALENNFVQSGIGTARFGGGQEVAAIAAVVEGLTIVSTVATAQALPGNYSIELRFDSGGVTEFTRVESGALVHLTEGITSMSRIWGDQAGGDTVDFELSGFQPNKPITVAFGQFEVVGIPTGFSALAKLTVDAPASLVDGVVDVRLTQDNAQLGVKVTTSPNAWLYDGPEVLSIHPVQDQLAGGMAAEALVDGFMLGSVDVFLGGAFAPGLILLDDGQQVARFTVPPGLKTGLVDLRLVQGVYDVVLADGFTYLPPAITGVTPQLGAWYNAHSLLINAVGLNSNIPTQVAIGDSAPQPANFVDASTLRVAIPAGVVVGAGTQPLKVTQGPVLTVLKGGWTSLPDLGLLSTGSAAVGGSVSIRVRALGTGSAWVLTSGALVPTPVPLFGIHYGLGLDPNGGHVVGQVGLTGMVPTATYPFGPGVLQPGTTLHVQVLTVELLPSGAAEMSLTNVASVTIP